MIFHPEHGTRRFLFVARQLDGVTESSRLAFRGYQVRISTILPSILIYSNAFV